MYRGRCRKAVAKMLRGECLKSILEMTELSVAGMNVGREDDTFHYSQSVGVKYRIQSLRTSREMKRIVDVL